jgi:N-acetylglucosaminyldiphosphoundecaprenol N-acetyl-beta-D-mannosaminyltransferase
MQQDSAMRSNSAGSPQSRTIVGVRVDVTSYEKATHQILEWARKHESRYVCASAVNNLVQALDSEEFRDVMNKSDLVTPDGMPLVWAQRVLGATAAERVYGPRLTEQLCASAEQSRLSVGFLGGSPPVLATLLDVIAERWPHLHVAFACSPPFRQLDDLEQRALATDINESGAQILFVGLGTPKQDRWMAENIRRITTVMVGVGAAFDFLAGAKAQAPRLVQNAGLEWLFRLVCEPRRLWRRYLIGNPKFI